MTEPFYAGPGEKEVVPAAPSSVWKEPALLRPPPHSGTHKPGDPDPSFRVSFVLHAPGRAVSERNIWGEPPLPRQESWETLTLKSLLKESCKHLPSFTHWAIEKNDLCLKPVFYYSVLKF